MDKVKGEDKSQNKSQDKSQDKIILKVKVKTMVKDFIYWDYIVIILIIIGFILQHINEKSHY